MEVEKNTKHFSFGAGTGIIAGISNFAGKTLAMAGNVKILVDPSSMDNNSGTKYKGLGCISSGSSSKLLLDYKVLHPEIYDEILNLLFQKGYGVELSHIKIELGSDINSSSGSEPSTMRDEYEQADVTRGAGFIFVSDALKINPELTIDLIRYDDAEWVKNAFAESNKKGYRARYKWYVDTIESAYKFGIKFTHISPDKSGTDNPDSEWLVYFSKRFKSEKNKLYDYSKIKIVSEGLAIAEEMLKNQELLKSVDILGIAYSSQIDENVKSLLNSHRKEVWYSEGMSPCNVSKFAINCDGNGISGIDGTLNIATRIVNSCCNKMTLYEFKPAVAGYYNGTYGFPKQLITANAPWSGYYTVNSGFYMAMHFTRFVEKNWRFIESACYGDGDEDIRIYNTSNNYITLMPENKSELTMIFSNDTSKSRIYNIDISQCNMNQRKFSIVETKAPYPNEHYAVNWFRVRDVKKPFRGHIYFEVKPHSLVTLTTMNTSFIRGIDTVKRPSVKKKRLLLPYNDSFSYPDNFLKERGTAPLLTNDFGGAFEICNNVLQQKSKNRSEINPVTCLGDDTWVNYSAEIEFILDDYSADNYAGIAVHYDEIDSGCSVKIYANEKAEIYFMGELVSECEIDNLQRRSWNTVKILALANIYMVYLNDKFIGDFEEKNIIQACGRVAILSGFYENRFRNIDIQPVSNTVQYADRIDALSSRISYTRDAVGNSETSYKYSNRTNVTLEPWVSFELNYQGYGFALCGTVEQESKINIIFDGRKLNDGYITVGGTAYKQAFYRMSNIENGRHHLKVTVISGKVILDSVLAFNNSEKPVII